jgi:hypothetical protein
MLLHSSGFGCGPSQEGREETSFLPKWERKTTEATLKETMETLNNKPRAHEFSCARDGRGMDEGPVLLSAPCMEKLGA